MHGWSTAAAAAASAPDDPVDYRALVADSADLNTVASADGVYRYVSPASQRLFGWDPSELEGREEDDFVHPHDLPSFRP